ncbi:glycine betaine ABC transporter substrate-binding protein [Marisediminicola sp. LYQ134]|uniref:glycine betaine ABC transporter substrate-binding protein n=1 Tax=unclassified Marisediminicola TaxID=2618316 RepID=UPI003983D734
MSSFRRPLLATIVAGTALTALAGCGLQPATAYVPPVGPGSIEELDLPDDASITITSKNFTEQLILGKIAVIAASAAGFEVEDLTNVPGSVPVRELMLSGDADMTWEYTGTAWLTFLAEEEGIPDQQEQYEAVRDADAENGLTWLPTAPLNNTYAMAVRTEAVEELDGVATLSDVAALPVEDRTFCVEPEFNSRADGMSPMLEAYDLERGSDDGVPESNIGIFDTGAVYTATDRGTCNFGEVFTTDGRIDQLDLTVLEDDRGFFPAYNVAAVLATETLEEYPELEQVFGQISPEITDETLRELNLRVDSAGEEPADVALDFMLDRGFVTEP